MIAKSKESNLGESGATIKCLQLRAFSNLSERAERAIPNRNRTASKCAEQQSDLEWSLHCPRKKFPLTTS
jgi:hypothetical protein